MKIKDFATVVSGATPKTNVDDNWGDEYLWITPAEIDGKVKYIDDTERKLSEKGVKSASLNLLPKGTVLLSSRAPIGKVAIANVDMYCNQGFKNLICNIKLAEPEYIYYWLSTNTEYLNSLGRGATFKEISKSIVEEIDIPLQSIENQKKIVQTLDLAQSLIDKRKKQIEACDELIKSRFVEMFGDPITNSKKLPLITLGEACNMKAGKGIKACDIDDEFEEGLYPCYGGNGLRGYVKEYTHDGTIPLIGRQGALCGNVQFAKGRFYATEHAVVTQPTIDWNPCWLFIMLREMNLNRLATGAAQPGLNVSSLVPLEVINPPLLLQNQFATFVQQVDKLKFILQKSLHELDDNFNVLVQKAFKGELFSNKH